MTFEKPGHLCVCVCVQKFHCIDGENIWRSIKPQFFSGGYGIPNRSTAAVQPLEIQKTTQCLDSDGLKTFDGLTSPPTKIL